jgi:hypothetical protein
MTIRRSDLAPTPANDAGGLSPVNEPARTTQLDGVYRNNRRIASGFEPNFAFKTGDMFVQAGERTIAAVNGTSITFVSQNSDVKVAAK